MDVNKDSSPATPCKRFSVDDVEIATSPLQSQNWEKIVSEKLGFNRKDGKGVPGLGSSRKGGNTDIPEAFSKPIDGVNTISTGSGEISHGFVSAVHLAYDHHYPLVITPDDIWLCIVQGFATHVNKNSEKLRHHLVEFEGKKKITIRRNDFALGSPLNPWPETFSEFSSEIRQHIGEKTHNLLVPTFTTTGPTEKAAAEIVLMESLKKYFDYELNTRCGIPEVQLRGTVDDWKQLREKALSLGQFELEWWTEKCLSPVLDELVATSEGRINIEFWSRIYKHIDRSGGPYISGWILKLFPYIDSWKSSLDRTLDVTTTKELPSGISAVPFIWEYFGKEIGMKLYAGFMGVAQDPNTLSVSSAVGWAVAKQPVEQKTT